MSLVEEELAAEVETAERCCTALSDVFRWNSFKPKHQGRNFNSLVCETMFTIYYKWKVMEYKWYEWSLVILEKEREAKTPVWILTWNCGSCGLLLFGGKEGPSKICEIVICQ